MLGFWLSAVATVLANDSDSIAARGGAAGGGKVPPMPSHASPRPSPIFEIATRP